MMDSEHIVQRAVMLAVGGRPDCRIFRNSLGRFQDATGRWVRFGIANPGGADLIGWRTVNGVARFLAIECKSERGQTTEAQDTFLQAVRRAGGIGIVARSVEEAIAGLDGDGPSS